MRALARPRPSSPLPPALRRQFPLPAWLVLAALALLAFPGAAREVRDLYEVEVPVASRASEDRDRALAQALDQLTVKLTGDRRTAGHRGLARAREQAGGYVQQYRYRSLPPEPGAAAGLALSVSFDPRAVDGLLREAGLPLWGRVRPAMVVWVALEEPGGRRFAEAGEIAEELTRVVHDRGVPFVLPLLDLEDLASVRLPDLWAGSLEGVRAASERYAGDGVLVARIAGSGAGEGTGQWSLLVGGGWEEWQSRGADRAGVLAAGLEEAADRLAARFAVRRPDVGAPGRVRVVVDGVRSVSGYGRLLGYLESLDAVDGVRIIAAEGERLTLELQAPEGIDGLRRVVAFGGVVALGDAMPDGSGTLELRLLSP